MDDAQPFLQDIEESQRRLSFHQRLGAILRVLTLGLVGNRSRISAAKRFVAECESDFAEYQTLNERDTHLNEALDAVSIRGIRVIRYAFADVPVEMQCEYGTDWDVLRDIILERDGYECQEADGRCGGPLQIHHIMLLSKGGNNHHDNLITLCHFHHSLKHEHMRR